MKYTTKPNEPNKPAGQQSSKQAGHRSQSQRDSLINPDETFVFQLASSVMRIKQFLGKPQWGQQFMLIVVFNVSRWRCLTPFCNWTTQRMEMNMLKENVTRSTKLIHVCKPYLKKYICCLVLLITKNTFYSIKICYLQCPFSTCFIPWRCWEE